MSENIENSQRSILERLIRHPARLRFLFIMLFVLLLLILGARILYEFQPWRAPGKIAQFLQSMGPLAPVIYIILLSIAVILPPIPDTVPIVVAGVGFGGPMGTVYTMVGVMLGTTVSFYLASRFGRRLLERFVSEKRVSRLDSYASRMGWGLLFWSRLVGLNSGLVSYAAGLTKMSLASFLSATVLGTLPQVLIISFSGQELLRHPVLFVLGMAGLGLLTKGARAIWKRVRRDGPAAEIVEERLM